MRPLEDFVHTDASNPHLQRQRNIIQAHPELRELIGIRNPATFIITALCVITQVVMAYYVSTSDWWVNLLVAYFFGAFVSHTLFVCVHDAAHNLVFKKVWANSLTAILANFPSVFPTALSFKAFHLKHHTSQGAHDMDADLPDYYEAKLFKNYFIGKIIWLFFFPIFQAIRTLRCRNIFVYDKWVIMNISFQIIFDLAIIYFLGWGGFVYLVMSFWFSVGLHPLGARWVQEHYLILDKSQETYSYYGILNIINMNVGYHNEHHDFPAVSWNKLPTIKKTAPEFYETLKYHTSYTSLFFRFIFDQEISLFSRIVRKNKILSPQVEKALLEGSV